MNQVALVGRIVKDPTVETFESGKVVSNITIAISRPYKNVDGIYETDFINCVLWEGVATNIAEYCKKGDLIAVRGRLQNNNYEKDGQKVFKLEVVAEKVSFLARAREDDIPKEENAKTKKSKEER